MAEIELRPYQQEARDAVLAQWDGGHSRTLLVLPTGCGKTIVFSAVIREEVKRGHRVLVLAHRAELLQQAADKLNKTTGLGCSVEKAEESCFGSWFRVTVGSVQSLCRPTRLAKFSEDYFDTIIIDEAHHALSASYQAVLDHFSKARVLGVTATPERGDHRNLGQYFESLAYEYTLPEAIHNGYLCPIRAQTIPLQIDLSGVTMQNGDYAAGSLGNALDPYLEQIADKLIDYAGDRKTVVFLPLIATSQKFCQLLNDRGMKAAEVNGDSENRAEILQAFDKGEYQVLCNSMLLTEGWDCPSVDCIVVLRPTKIRGLFVQMVGRGTRLFPGKENLLLLDFLWMIERHELCRPACLICKDDAVARKMTENMEDGEAVDLEEAEEEAESDVINEREQALAQQLAAMRKKKARLVDPLQFAMSIHSYELANYQPSFLEEEAAPTQKTIDSIEKLGIFAGEIKTQGEADQLLRSLHSRIDEGLSTPKQIRFLEQRGFKNVGMWKFEDANKMIWRISANNWKIPWDIEPKTYRPKDASWTN